MSGISPVRPGATAPGQRTVSPTPDVQVANGAPSLASGAVSFRLIRNTLANVLQLGANMGAQLLLPPFIVAFLGKDAYAIWVLVLSFTITGFFSFLDLGFQQATVKLMAEYTASGQRQRIGELYGASLRIYLLMGVLAAAILAGLAAIGPQRLFNLAPGTAELTVSLLLLFALRTLLEFPAFAFSGMLRGRERFDLVRAVDVGRILLGAAGIIAALHAGRGLIAMALVDLLTTGGRLVALALLAHWKIPGLQLTWRVSQEVFRRILRFSAGMVLIKLGTFINNSVDKLLIGVLLISTALADYDVAHKMNMMAMATMYLASSAILPVASAAGTRGDDLLLRRLMLLGTKYTVLLTVPLSVLLAVLARPFISSWIGPQFAGDAVLAQLFLGHVLLTALIPVGQDILYGLQRIRPVARIVAITSAIKISTSVALCLWIGLPGVIWGTLITAALSLVLHLRLFRAELGVGVRQVFTTVVLRTYPLLLLPAAALAALIRWRQPSGLVEVLVLGAAGMAFYCVLFLLFGMERQERDLLRSLLTRRKGLAQAAGGGEPG